MGLPSLPSSEKLAEEKGAQEEGVPLLGQEIDFPIPMGGSKPCPKKARNAKFPDVKQLTKELGTSVDEYHSKIKPDIVKDFRKELKAINSTNPDIGIDSSGNIAFRNPKTGATISTNVSLNSYRP